MFYPDLLTRYQTMLSTADSFYINAFDNTEHLIWMINELMTNEDQSLTKKHRWLGYIQHAIISAGFTDVRTERDYTRDIFNGD